MYVKAELPRESNERLLNNLKEGVFILHEDKNKILFTNSAAQRIGSALQPDFEQQIVKARDNSDVFDDPLKF